MWDKILGIKMMEERKYGDFPEKSPHLVPLIELWYSPLHDYSEKSKSAYNRTLKQTMIKLNFDAKSSSLFSSRSGHF